MIEAGIGCNGVKLSISVRPIIKAREAESPIDYTALLFQ